MIEILMRPFFIRTFLPSLGSALLLVSGLGAGSAQAQVAADAHARYSDRYDDDRGSSRSPPSRGLKAGDELRQCVRKR